MAMDMQDAFSLPIAEKRSPRASQSSVKAECIYNPEFPADRRCKSGDWIIDKLIPNISSFDVVTIVGPLAHGKSHSLNARLFSDMNKTFASSMPPMFEEQRDADGPGTIGVWAALQNYDKFLVFDTQGYYEKALFEVADRDPTAISAVRNAVKLMALSNIVIFHTSTLRIDPKETFRFLQEASVVMEDRLRSIANPQMKPYLIVFHQVLQEHPLDSAKLRSLLGDSVCNAFRDIHYMPVVRSTEVDFAALSTTIIDSRTPHREALSFKQAFDTLFSPESEMAASECVIEDKKSIVPQELFVCPFKCLACGKSCALLHHSSTTAHRDTLEVSMRQNCQTYSETHKNRAFFCRQCNTEASVTNYSPDDYSVIKIFKYYTQSVNLINCEKCKTIYRSDEACWPPDKRSPAVETKLFHVWDAPGRGIQPTSIAPAVYYTRALLDPLADVTDSLASIVKPKAQTVHNFVVNNVRPHYWVPNESSTQCRLCGSALPEIGDKHHCRQCGDIFCETCSSRKQPVPERGWGTDPVRVCNNCFGKPLMLAAEDAAVVQETGVNGRWMLEQATRFITAAESVVSAAADTVVSRTEPEYWQKDTDPDAGSCNICKQSFDKTATAAAGSSLQEASMMSSSSSLSSSAVGNPADKRRHHCRSCGKFVCGNCSPFRIAVPERGWGERPVRVCNTCFTSKQPASTLSDHSN